MDNSLIVFAKAPVPGLAKTRMIPVLGEKGAAELQRELILRTLKQNTSPKQWDTQLWCAPDLNHPIFSHAKQQYDLELFTQLEGDLGLKMGYAFKVALSKYPHAVIVGTDCPAMNAAIIRQSFAALLSGNDAVVVPALDGGYTLLGLKQCHPSIFKGINWGSTSVMEQTRERLKALNWKVAELEPMWDLDEPQDLERYNDLKNNSGFGNRMAAGI